MPRGRGFCRDEHHAALGVGLVRRDRHGARDARLLPLALRADRAACRSLCGPAVLPERVARAASASAQYGCADLARCAARTRDVSGRDCEPRDACLLRLGDYAAVLFAVRTRARPCDAAQDARGRRQSGGAEGRIRASSRWRRTGARAGGHAQTGRPAAGAARRARAR